MPWPRFRPRNLRIREKLILQFVLVAALTFGLAGLLIIRAARRSLEERITTENEALARAAGTLVEKRVEQAIRDLGDAAFARNIREALEARDIQRLEPRLKRLRETVDLFSAVGVLDREGILLASSPPVIALRGQSFASREYYRAVVSSREPVLSPGFRRAAPPHGVTSAVAAPVTDARGHLLGVLVASLDLSQLESQIRLVIGAGPHRVILLDRTGRALIHPEPEHLLQFPPPEPPGDAPAPSSQIFLRDVGWTLTVSQPAGAALAPLAPLETAIRWALLVGVAGAVALAAVVATRFTRPVEALRRDVQALAAADPRERTRGGDELTGLRREFDRMRARLTEQAEVVTARTGALEALLDIASAVNASLELDTVLGEALERTLAITGADLGTIRLYDADRGVLEALCSRGDWWRPDVRPAIRHVGEGVSGRAAAARAPMFLTGEGADLGLLATAEGARAAAAIPLLARDRLQGTMVLVYRRPHDLTDRERQLLGGISHQIGTAIENARLFRQTHDQAAALQTLALVEQQVTTSLEPGRVADMVCKAALPLLRAAYARIWLLEPDGRHLGLSAAAAAGDPPPAAVTRLPLEGSLIGWVVRERQVRYSPHLREDPLLKEVEWVRVAGFVSQLAVPLMHGERALGALLVVTRDLRQFSEFERDLLCSLAAQAAIAIENAGLFALSQRRLERAQALYETGQAVSGTLDLRELFDLLIAKTAEHLKVNRCALLQFELRGEEMALAYRAGRGLSPKFTAGFRIRVGEGTTGRAVQLRRPVWSADVLNDPAITLSPAVRARVEAEGYRAVLSAPILAGGEPLAVLAIYRDEVGAFSTEEVEFLQALANQAGLAIHNARLFGDLRGQTHRLESLIRVSRLIATNLELEELLTAIVRTCTELLGMDAASLWTLDTRERALEAQVDYGLTAVTARHLSRFDPGVGFMGQVLAERRVLVSADFAEDPRVANRDWARREGLVAAAGVPLLVGEKALGTLAVFKRSPTTFSEADITLLSSFASQAAIAIQNARLFAELKEDSERLEERVRERTAALEEASRAKSQFLANMSHELRTPLNAIIGFSALLEEGRHGSLTEKQRRFVRHVQSSGRHLLAVINDILDLTRVEAGRLELALERVELGGIVEEALTLVREEASAKGLGLTAEVPDGIRTAVADPVRLRQILYNLLSNAVKFTPEGGTVTVGAAGDGDGVAVWVRDTGIGIAPEDQERIFREFEQVDNSSSRRHQGAGLGLTLTRRLVELHGGRIRVESTPGMGSTFTFTIPQRVPGDVPAAQS